MGVLLLESISDERTEETTRMPRKPKELIFDDDNPEWTEADFANATWFEGGLKATDLTPEILEQIRNARLHQPRLHHRGLDERRK
jgi:hypothetical protein